MLFLWHWRLGKVIGIVFLVLTVVATLGSGEHYAFDLICAVPYTWGGLYIARLSLHNLKLTIRTRMIPQSQDSLR